MVGVISAAARAQMLTNTAGNISLGLNQFLNLVLERNESVQLRVLELEITKKRLNAERVLGHIHRGRQTVHDWLAGDDQSLFRRGQLRQILTLLRDDDPALYVSTVTDLVTAPDVRSGEHDCRGA